MRPVVGWLVATVMMAGPAIAVAGGGEYDPCRNRGPRRIAIVYARSSGLLGREGECKGNVYPDKKTACAGDTVQWSVINTCDAEVVTGVRLEGLERVTEKCSAVQQLELGAAREIRCRLKRTLAEDVKQEYQVRGQIGKSPTVVDPELIIRRPN